MMIGITGRDSEWDHQGDVVGMLRMSNDNVNEEAHGKHVCL